MESLDRSDEDVQSRPFVCDWKKCKKSFNRKIELRTHYRVHTNERPYACSTPGCGKSFMQRSALIVHIRTHIGEKPHQCRHPGCGERFSDSSSLNRHQRVRHSEKRARFCGHDGCLKSFCRKSTAIQSQTQRQAQSIGPNNFLHDWIDHEDDEPYYTPRDSDESDDLTSSGVGLKQQQEFYPLKTPQIRRIIRPSRRVGAHNREPGSPLVPISDGVGPSVSIWPRFDELSWTDIIANSDLVSDNDSSIDYIGISVALIENWIISLTGHGGTSRTAEHAFTNLLHSTADLRDSARPLLGENSIANLINPIRKWIKVLERDLAGELSADEYAQISRFFPPLDREVSDEIFKDLSESAEGNGSKGEPVHPSDAEHIDVETDPQTAIGGILSRIAPTDSFQTFVKRLRFIKRSSFESRLTELLKWEVHEMDDPEAIQSTTEAISELLYSKPRIISRFDQENASWIENLSISLGACLPVDWDCRPFSPQRMAAPGYAGLRWKCVCGETRHVFVPEAFARRIISIRKETTHGSVSSSTRPPIPMHPSVPFHGNSQFPVRRNVQATSFQAVQSSLHPRSASSDHSISVPMPTSSRYVMFMVDTDRLHLSVIESQSLCNEQLFNRLRAEYRQIKGWYKRCFGLMTFSHCEFYKFEAWTHGRYCERGRGIPPLSNQEYYYRPRPMDNEPPISNHEFYDRFYQRIKSEMCLEARGSLCTECDAVDRIPQKKDAIGITANGRPQFWGIIAREKKSGIRMLLYILASCVPGLVFCFLWLFALRKDSLQDASVLLMISFSLLGILYSAQLF